MEKTDPKALAVPAGGPVGQEAGDWGSLCLRTHLQALSKSDRAVNALSEFCRGQEVFSDWVVRGMAFERTLEGIRGCGNNN